MTKRFLVIDDHPLFRAGVVARLGQLPDVVQIFEAETAQAALLHWREGPWDLVTLDLSLAGADGFALLRQAKAEQLPGAVVVLSMHEDRSYQEEARAQGAVGFVPKSAGVDVLLAAVEACVAGGEWFWSLAHAHREPFVMSPEALSERLRVLTTTERRILQLIGRRLTSREIAQLLGSSTRTIENHRASICRKLSFRGPHRLLEFALGVVDTLPPPITTSAASDGGDA